MDSINCLIHNEANEITKSQTNNVGDDLIILLTRFPRAGQTKTRLIPDLGAQGAALFQKDMAEFTILEALATRVPLQIHFTGGTKEEMQDWIYGDIFCQKIPYHKPTYEEIFFQKTSHHKPVDEEPSSQKTSHHNSVDEEPSCQKISHHNSVDEEPSCQKISHHNSGYEESSSQKISHHKQVDEEPSYKNQPQNSFCQNKSCQEKIDSEFYVNVEFIPQCEGDLGQRMQHAFNNAFAHIFKHSQNNNIKKIILVGSDCPDNRRENMSNALSMLDKSTCVIGPSSDGGYYLIGLAAQDFENSQAQYAQLFSNIAWGTNSVFQDTKQYIKQHQLLPILSDVDLFADIPKKISVIIPVLNDAKYLQHCLETLPKAFNIEIIVVDGKSSDKTCMIAQELGAIVCHSEAGRALQMHEGAKFASGEILFFLHADSCLPPLWDKQIRGIMNNNNSLGYFCFAIKESFWGKNIIMWGTNIRARFLHLPYGDQGLFVRKKDFEAWNIKITPILEDVFLVKKARQYGKICCTNTKLYTSGRRWLKYGIIRTMLINQSILISAYLGMDLHILRDAYLQGKNPLFIFIKNLIQKGLNIWKK